MALALPHRAYARDGGSASVERLLDSAPRAGV